MTTTYSATPADIHHAWHLVDAEGKTLGPIGFRDSLASSRKA